MYLLPGPNMFMLVLGGRADGTVAIVKDGGYRWMHPVLMDLYEPSAPPVTDTPLLV